jgi:hypothetical protein
MSCCAKTTCVSPFSHLPLCAKCQQLPQHMLVRMHHALDLGYCLATLRAEGPHLTKLCEDAIADPQWLLSRLESRVAREPSLFHPARARADAATMRREKRDAAPAFDAYRKAVVEAGVHQSMLYGPHSVAVGRGLITAEQGLQFALGGRDAWCFMRRHWRAFQHVSRLAANPLHRTAGALKEVARCAMRGTHLFTVRELRQGWLESWALTSRCMPTARSIELAVVRRLLHCGGDADDARTRPINLYQDASRVPWSIATHAYVVNASGRAATRALLLHLARRLGVLEGGMVARAVLQRVFASDGLRA